MKTTDQVCEQILGNEGGFVNDPADAGGPTQWGISLNRFAKTLPKVNGKSPMDLNGDGVVDINDIKLVTKAIAKQLYLDHFFHGPGIDRFPEALQPCLFDMSVNAGPGGAIKVMQTALFVQGAPIAIDGKISDGLVAQSCAMQAKLGNAAAINALVAGRIAYYQGIVRNNASQAKFIHGWTNRAQEFAA